MSSGKAPTTRDWLRCALAAHREGRLDVARTGYLRVLVDEPRHPEALSLLAVVLHQRGEAKMALGVVRRALEVREDAVTLCVAGSVLRAAGDHAAAIGAYRRALVYSPESAQVHHDLALALAAGGRSDEAEAAYRRALAFKPDYPEAHNNLGVLYKNLARPGDAEAAYRAALACDPDYPEAHNNLGVLYKESGRLAEAEPAYRRAIELRPDYADARWNLAMVLLAQGRYDEGWPYYEARYHAKRTEAVSVKPALDFAQWQGEALAGRSLLVWSEQGHGDYVQFARYFPRLKALGVTRLTVACAPPLVPLLATVAGVDRVISSHKEVDEHDFWIFALSLPMVFAASREAPPASVPYVAALPARLARWRPRVAGDGLKVGLVWKGNPGHSNDAQRSLSGLEQLSPLWTVGGVDFYSLQKGSGEDEAAGAPESRPITALGSEIADFADTAAIVALLDLVICVDTAVAHVAGALGKPCWVLLPHYECDWRWQRERSDSPWYPQVMRLFRQKRSGDWQETIAEVAASLRHWAAG